ncbi:MAG: WG repeat-containing protein [Bacteroidota bacterium]
MNLPGTKSTNAIPILIILWAIIFPRNICAQPTPDPEKYPSGITEGSYDKVYPLSENISRVRKGEKYGFVNKEGVLIIDLIFDKAANFALSRARVSLNGKSGFINNSGEVIIPMMYDRCWSFKEGVAKVKLNDKYGFIDPDGAAIIPIEYDEAQVPEEEMILLGQGGKYGFFSTKGELSIPLRYDAAYSFFAGKARVRQDNHWFYVDKNGRCIEDCK